ncbi:MAG TPA: serine/threonine-protein kinase [Candidatus Competibacter sp.]|nr:serine/threonine-protein kinase [Candidatus Competibacter sp.]
MTDIVYQTAPIRHGIGRTNSPPLFRQPDADHIVSLFGAGDTAHSVIEAKRGVRRLNTLSPGSFLEEYRIEQTLGAGSFGVTYKAWDTLLETWVAIKEYFPVEWSFRDADGVTVHSNTQGGDVGGNDERLSDYLWGLERFLDEARVLARVQHPFVVRVKRYFRAHGTAYIVMDYEDGEPLNAILQDGETLSEDEVRGLLEDVLPALQAVHEQGFLHRDIKPANLYVRASDRRVILIDFGAARAAVGRHSKSVTSLVTPGYSPPEQYTTRNDRYGTWTDVYALGAVLYRCVTGRPPTEAAERLLEDSLEPAARAGAGRYSASLLRVIDRALAVRPEQRFHTVAEMQEALNDPPEEDSADDETAILEFFYNLAGPGKPHPAEHLSPGSAERVAEKDWLEISEPPTASWQRVDQRQDAMRSLPDVDRTGGRWSSMFLIGIGLALAALATLAAGVIWMRPFTPEHEQISLSHRAPEREKKPDEPMDVNPLSFNDPPLPVLVSTLIRAPYFEAFGILSQVAPLGVEQFILAQPPGYEMAQKPSSEANSLIVKPILVQAPAPESASKPLADTVSVPPTSGFAADFKAPTGSAARQAANNPAIGEAHSRQNGKSLGRPGDSARQAGRVQSRPRSRITNSRSHPNFWKKRGVVRNPWESPARTGFNQK